MGRKLAGLITRNMPEVVLKKGREASAGDGGGCGEVQSDRAPVFLEHPHRCLFGQAAVAGSQLAGIGTSVFVSQ